jgi:hypothetical protein
MLTEHPPRSKRELAEFLRSDALGRLKVPSSNNLRMLAASIGSALETGQRPLLRAVSLRFLDAASRYYGVERPRIRVLAARPLRVHEGGVTAELFGDYQPKSMVIRVWMKTAVRRRVTSFGAFLSTLCHEFCHHLDITRLGFQDSPHTRGFYERAAVLYHHARGTRRKKLFWTATLDGRWHIDWPRTNRQGRKIRKASAHSND